MIADIPESINSGKVVSKDREQFIRKMLHLLRIGFLAYVLVSLAVDQRRCRISPPPSALARPLQPGE